MRASTERQTGQVKLRQENDQNLRCRYRIVATGSRTKEGCEDGKNTTQRY